MVYPHFYCTWNIFYSASMHLRELYAQYWSSWKLSLFSLGLIFLLSFGSLGNHKNTNVYKRKVVGICNWRTRRDHPFWQKHGLRSILIENETVPLDKRSINRINHLKIIHQCPYLHGETYQFSYSQITVLEELTVQPSCSKVKITVIFEELLKNIINF